MNERMEKIYYNCEIINQTTSPVDAKYNVSLLKSIINDPTRYNINVNRFRLPLNGIPLSQNNIPFQKWEVGLGYLDPNTNQWSYKTGYVPQYNETFENIGAFVFAKNGNNLEIVEGQLNNGAFTVINTLPFTQPSNQSPLSTGNINYLIVAFVGLLNVYIYSHSLSLVTTITTTNPIQCIYINPTTSDLYIGQNGRFGFIVNHYVHGNNNTWTLGTDVYTAYANQITQPFNVVYNSNFATLYVSDHQTGKVFYWTQAGDVTQWFQNTDPTLLPSAMNVDANNNLVVVFSPSTQPLITDNIYMIRNKSVYTVNGIQKTLGDIVSQPVIAGSNCYCLGLGGFTYSQSYPFPQNLSWWDNVETVTTMRALFTDYNHNNLLSVGTGEQLYTLNISNSIGNNTWTQIGQNFKINPNTTIATLDSMNDNRIICSGSDNNVYVSNLPVAQRVFVSINTNATTFQLVGINNNNNGLQLQSILSNIPLNNPLGNQQSICFDGTYYYVGNSLGSVDKYNSFGQFVANYSFSECQGNIGYLHYGSKSGRIYASALASNNVANSIEVYDTNGMHLASLFNVAQGGNGCSNFFVEVSANGSPALFTANYFGTDGIIYISDVSNLTSITQLFILNTGATQVTGVFSTDNSLYLLENNNAIERFDFNSSYTINTLRTLVINLPVQAVYGMLYGASEIYVLAHDGNTYVYKLGNNYQLHGTISLAPNGSLLPLGIYGTSYIQFSQVAINNQVSSICSSRQNQNLFYATNTSQSGVMSGIISGTNTIDWYNLPYSAGSYSMLSCIGVPTQPSGATTTMIASYDNSHQQIKAQATQNNNIQFLSFDKNNSLVYSPSNTNQLVTTNGVGIVANTTNLYSYVVTSPVAVEGGKYTLTTYQDYLNQINLAFQNVYNEIKTQFPQFAPQQGPQIVYNSQSKLFYVSYDWNYTQTTTYRMLLNQPLWEMFGFPTQILAGVPSDTNGSFRTILITSMNYSSTVYQESSTIYKFYDLVRILVTTSKIPVLGDIEGINSTVNLITDVVPDTTTLSPNDVLIYQPSILRNYNLDSNVPLQHIDLQFYYGTRDGSIYKVMLNPNEYASVKIEFNQVV